MSKASEIATLIESTLTGPEALPMAEEILSAVAKAVGLDQVAALIDKVAEVLNDPATEQAATRAAYGATDVALDAVEAEKLAEISAKTVDP